MPGESVTVRRGTTPVVLHIPTPEQLNTAVIDAAMAVGALSGIADGLESHPEVGYVAPALRDIARNLERFIDTVEPGVTSGTSLRGQE
jgi:hypothetical protein